tara:strand:+ start:3147 stop:3479 length:333 start_codon:yes stop_codon:yes gene_type:complete
MSAVCPYKLKRVREIMSERSESKRIGAKLIKNSGRGQKKGDASWHNFIVDFKEVGKSFTLNKDVWAKATTDALKSNKDPAIVVVIGSEGMKTRLAVIEMALLEQLLEERE